MPSAARIQWAKFRVLVVSLVSLLILCTLLYLLTGGTLLEQKVTLYLYLPDATGLSSDSIVRVNGLDVGKVREVNLSGSNDPNRVVKAALTIERDRLDSIADNYIAELSSDTLIGDKFVDIHPEHKNGPRSPAHVRPNGEIVFKNTPELMKTLDLDQFAQQIKEVDAVLREIEQGRSPLGQFVLSEDMYNDVRKRLTQLHTAIRAATDVATNVGSAIYSDQLYQQISAPLVDLDRTLARLQAGQGGGGKLLRDPAEYVQMVSGFGSLRRSLADLRAGEYLQSDRMYDAWSRQLSSLIQRVDEMNADPSLSTTVVYDNLNGAFREMNDTIRELRQDPQKFLRMRVF